MKRLEEALPALPILLLLLSSQAAFGCGADSGDSPDADGGETTSDAGRTSDDAGRASDDAGRASDDAGSGHPLLEELGADMLPGEWRYIGERADSPRVHLPEGASKLRSVLHIRFCDESGGELVDGGQEGNGWMDEWVYDADTGSMWAALMRSSSEKALVWMDRDLHIHRVSMPWGWDCSSNRRPFDRLNLVDGHLYWPPKWWGERRVKNGVMHRGAIAPYLAGEREVEWELEHQDVGWGQTSSGTVGDFAVRWWPELGGWIMGQPGSERAWDHPDTLDNMQEGHTAEGARDQKTTGARLFYLRPGIDEEWVYFDRLYTQGYRLRILQNPLRPRELLVTPGGFSPPEQTEEWTRVELKEDGTPIARKLDEPSGREGSGYSIAHHLLTYNPRSGDYLWFSYNDESIYESADGKHWELYEDFADIESSALFPDGRRKFAGNGGLFGASAAIQAVPIVGTDLIVFFDYFAGVILHRVKE